MKKTVLIISLLIIGFFCFASHNSSHKQRLLLKNNWNYYHNRKIKLRQPGKQLNFSGQKINQVKKTDFNQNQADNEDSKNEDKEKDEKKLSLNFKGENLIRRAEILFFGSLTIVSFIGWLSLTTYNVIIYGDTFGLLRRNQFLALYLGSSVIAISVSLTDLLVRLRPFFKKKNIEVYPEET